MKERSFVLKNIGMNRDLSISKVGESTAYENLNIRITPHDGDTALSVTNERGNREVTMQGSIVGELIGWNVLNNHIILFTHDLSDAVNPDYIYRIDYLGDDSFVMVRGKYPGSIYDYQLNTHLFNGNLGFDLEHPIESVVYFETEDIQKIYWIDGKNVLRFMNFAEKVEHVMAEDAEEYYLLPWEKVVVEDNVSRVVVDNTYFDSNRAADFYVDVEISKDNSGETRANGTVQYLLTYFNKHGQETGYVWISDLVYLSPSGRGGAADETNNNKVTLSVRNLDTSFTHFRVYSVFRSSYNGTPVAYLVGEHATSDGTVTVIDDGAHLTLQDSSRLLYLGSQPVIAGTMAHKDQTLFLGDLQPVGRKDYSSIEARIKTTAFKPNKWESACIEFVYSDNDTDGIHDIDYSENVVYPYANQLANTSSEIQTFKGGEKYRFAIKFQLRDGTESDAFWIGDKENTKYPVIDSKTNKIKRVVVKCTLPPPLLNDLLADTDFKTVRLLIAEATYADRSVKAQGIVNPTVFNVWDRYNDRTYALSSWITRPRNSPFAFRHFEPIHKSDSSTGEIQCNYWTGDGSKNPYYQYTNVHPDATDEIAYTEEFEGMPDYQYQMIVYRIKYENLGGNFTYNVWAYIVRGILIDPNAANQLRSASFEVFIGRTQQTLFNGWDSYADDYSGESKRGWKYKTVSSNGSDLYRLEGYDVPVVVGDAYMNHGRARREAHNNLLMKLVEDFGVLPATVVKVDTFLNWCSYTRKNGHNCYFNDQIWGNEDFSNINWGNFSLVANAVEDGGSDPSEFRWREMSDYSEVGISGDRIPAYYKKHLMFVDENVVTLNSPELSYNMVSVDNSNYNFRVVGVAKVSGNISDYTVDAEQSSVVGESLDVEYFSHHGSPAYGIISWPLWKEYGIRLKQGVSDIADENRTPNDYELNDRIVRFWLHMWQKTGSITGYAYSSEMKSASTLNRKVFANLWYSHDTIYLDEARNVDVQSIRGLTDLDNQQYLIDVGKYKKTYFGGVAQQLTMPGILKYPSVFSLYKHTDTSTEIVEDMTAQHTLYHNTPILLEYSSDSHAVISFESGWQPRSDDPNDYEIYYRQMLLPGFFASEAQGYMDLEDLSQAPGTTGALVPWNTGEYAVNYARFINTLGTYSMSGAYDESAGTVSIVSSYISDSDKIKFEEAIQYVRSYFSGDVYTLFEFSTMGGTYYEALVRINEITFESQPGNMWHFLLNDAPVAGIVDEASDEHADFSSYVDQLDVTPVYDGQEVAYYEYEHVGVGLMKYSNGSTSHDVTKIPIYDTFRNIGGFVPNDSSAQTLSESDQYIVIGEIYEDFGSGEQDIRYGGVSESAVKANRFINAGPAYIISSIDPDNAVIYGNQGDTYFQRWDCMRTKPYSNDSENNVIDIVSFMVESHINLDGCSDNQRGLKEIASIDTTAFNTMNMAYSQPNNFSVRRDLDADFNTDAYRSSITWTLPKADMADVDEWSHITLASTLNLDGDKGHCNALHRLQNSIIAFQDRGISEILFNSRTQLSTQDGVPVEIANSGKVDGKRYLTNKYGCRNKWSITEGKNGLYFIDGINKAFCSFTGNSVDNISSRLGFGLWFRQHNSLDSWKPNDYSAPITFYDKVNTDVYVVGQDENGLPCLVYNENISRFVSFYSYEEVPMMANVLDNFVSFKNNHLWLQNKGGFCNFFNEQFPFYMIHRVTPDPYGDKIWTDIEYRADFFSLDDAEDGNYENNETMFMDSVQGAFEYEPNRTFDTIRFWNEYQTTASHVDEMGAKKKFRVWRFAIPRAIPDGERNPYGLDRMRNPWLNILLRCGNNTNDELVHMHDIIIKYFE